MNASEKKMRQNVFFALFFLKRWFVRVQLPSQMVQKTISIEE